MNIHETGQFTPEFRWRDEFRVSSTLVFTTRSWCFVADAAAGSWTPSPSLPRQAMAGDGREEMPWENLFADHMQDDFATVSGSGSSPEEEVFSNL